MTVPSVLPTDWKIVPLGELLKSAQSGFASGARDPNGVIQMRMNNVTTDGNIDWTTFIRIPASREQLDKYRLCPGDVLFNSTNSPELVGKSVTFDGYAEPVVFSNHFVRLRVDETRLDPWYLGRWLTKQWQRRVFQSVCTRWVNQAAVRKADLLSLKVPLPPLPDQKRIAAILAKADRLRRQRRYARDLSDTYLQSVFLQIFGDPVTNPMGWDSATIRSLCDKTIDYRGRTPPYSDDGIPHITASCIKNSRIDWSQCKWVNEETYASYMTRGLPEFGDVIFTTEAPMGETAIVDTQARFSLAQRLLLLRTDRSRMDPHYLCSLLSHLSFFPKLKQYVTGSTVLGIRSVHLVSIRISVPRLDLQQQFARIVHTFERLRAQQREAQRQGEHLFQTLLHRAFQGEL